MASVASALNRRHRATGDRLPLKRFRPSEPRDSFEGAMIRTGQEYHRAMSGPVPVQGADSSYRGHKHMKMDPSWSSTHQQQQGKNKMTFTGWRRGILPDVRVTPAPHSGGSRIMLDEMQDQDAEIDTSENKRTYDDEEDAVASGNTVESDCADDDSDDENDDDRQDDVDMWLHGTSDWWTE